MPRITCWKEFVFQICVTSYNSILNHRTFTVSAINDNINPKSCNTNKTPFVEGDCGQTSASACNTVAAGTDEPNRTGVEDKECSRKRPRE
ncbi:unnamed protein product [Brassica rapa subsp. narinosa]